MRGAPRGGRGGGGYGAPAPYGGAPYGGGRGGGFGGPPPFMPRGGGSVHFLMLTYMSTVLTISQISWRLSRPCSRLSAVLSY